MHTAIIMNLPKSYEALFRIALQVLLKLYPNIIRPLTNLIPKQNE